jgi:hypothetical protein
MEIKTDAEIRTSNGMLILPFWQTVSINRCLLIKPSLTCGAEKVWDESDKETIC